MRWGVGDAEVGGRGLQLKLQKSLITNLKQSML